MDNFDLRFDPRDPPALGVRTNLAAVGSRAYRLGWVLTETSEAGALGLSILVVESDPAARSVLLDHLRRHGFRIVEAEHGGPAIRTAVVEPFDYMLADLDWNGVSDGAALARWARTNRPETRVILSSKTLSHWFPSDSAMAGLPIIKKPFAQDDLDRVLTPAAVTAIPGS